MTLLTTIQGVARQLGLPQPTAALSATDDMVEQWVQLAQEAGDDLMRDHDWQELTVVRTFTAIAAQAQIGEPPTTSVAFDRFAQDSEIYKVSTKRPLSGPINPRGWVRLTIDNLGNPDGYWTLIGGVLNLLPIPEITETFTYVYVTRNWIRLAAGDQSSDVATWTSDSNTALFPERLLRLAVIWKWLQVKGLDYAEALSTYEREKIRTIARDRGPRIIAMTETFREGPPDTWWPGTISELTE